MKQKSASLLGNVAALTIALLAGCVDEPATIERVGGDPVPTATATAAVTTAAARARLLQPPAGCTELDASAFDFQNGVELTPVLYSQSPTYRAAITALGDPAVTDSLRIRLDAATAPGLYGLSGANSNTFTCDQCVIAFADAPANQMYVADAGSLLLAAVVSPEQTFGALFDVTLRQAVTAAPTAAPYTGSAFVPGGACYWIRFATWNTIRRFGCSPEHDSFTSHLPGFTCVATSRAANDGALVRSTGDDQHGDACTRVAATATAPASSSCATGHACSSAFSSTPVCLETCDYMAPSPGCGEGLVCGPLGLCIEQSVLEPIGYAFDPAAIGEPCANDYAEFCGSEGARGVCVALGGPGTALCYPYRRARSDCAPGEELGYVSYPLAGGGFDRTYGWCYPDGL